MTLDEFKNLDPQKTISVRFGTMNEEGEAAWDDHWTDVRLLVSHSYEQGVWTITPMSLDGRPSNFHLEGHDEPFETAGIFASDSTSYVMQVRAFVEAPLLAQKILEVRNGSPANLTEALLDDMFFVEDLSPQGALAVMVVDALAEGGSPEDLMAAIAEFFSK
jgi:hypothetical protein